MIRKSVWSEYNAEDMKITWTGSEDKYSLVLGSGRPFIVKVINPKIKGSDEKKVFEKDVELYFRKIKQEEIDYYCKYRILVTIFVKLNEKIGDIGHFRESREDIKRRGDIQSQEQKNYKKYIQCKVNKCRRRQT